MQTMMHYMQEEYSKLMLEWDEAMQKTTRLQQEVQEVYNNFPEVPMEVDTPLEEKVTKISESIQGFRAKIVDLEAHTMPSTPPEEREQWEKTTMMTMESIRSLDEECTKLYEESTQVWTQLLENAELQALEQRLQTVQEKAQKIKETMSTLPPTE
jgi:predicted  nucleic acid-binding Zn-ribbon protein